MFRSSSFNPVLHLVEVGVCRVQSADEHTGP
jgi:hypothetical protein